MIPESTNINIEVMDELIINIVLVGWMVKEVVRIIKEILKIFIFNYAMIMIN